MTVKESKTGDSLTLITIEGHFNKGKKYNKDHSKVKIPKYFRMAPEVSKELEKYANNKRKSQSAIIEKAVKEFLNIN